MQNIESFTQFMRFKRMKDELESAVHPNQAGYREGHSPELLVAAMSTAAKQVALKEDRVLLDFTDLDKAFDKMIQSGHCAR